MPFCFYVFLSRNTKVSAGTEVKSQRKKTILFVLKTEPTSTEIQFSTIA